MDINKIGGRIHPPEVAESGRVKGEGGFARILDGAMETTQPKEALQRAMSTAINKVVPSAACEVSRADRQSMECASRMLDLMEEYTQALNDPKRTLKSIEPLVARMQEAFKGFDVQYGTHSDQTNELAKLANQIAVTASVEAFKFQRGDYIA